MKNILKLIGFYKINNVIELFVLNGIVKRDSIVQNKINILMISSLLFLAIISSIISNNIILFLILLLSISLFSYFIGASLDFPVFKKHFRKFLKKQFKVKLKKNFNVDFKDEKFKTFINEYYYDIDRQNLSKKETINIINNWKKSEKDLKKAKEERLDILNEIEALKEKLNS